jgi:hypothetical protein
MGGGGFNNVAFQNNPTSRPGFAIDKTSIFFTMFFFSLIHIAFSFVSLNVIQITQKASRRCIIALMMEAASTSETSANFYHTIRRNNPENKHFLLAAVRT